MTRSLPISSCTSGEPPELTRDQARSRRAWLVRAKSLNLRREPRAAALVAALGYQADLHALGGVHPERPKTRAECANGPRPCPFLSCRFSLKYDITRTGSLTDNFPGVALENMVESCALDVADRGGTTLEHVGALMNLTRERVRQVEERVLPRIAPALSETVDGYDDHYDDEQEKAESFQEAAQ